MSELDEQRAVRRLLLALDRAARKLLKRERERESEGGCDEG